MDERLTCKIKMADKSSHVIRITRGSNFVNSVTTVPEVNTIHMETCGARGRI